MRCRERPNRSGDGFVGEWILFVAVACGVLALGFMD